MTRSACDIDFQGCVETIGMSNPIKLQSQDLPVALLQSANLTTLSGSGFILFHIPNNSSSQYLLFLSVILKQSKRIILLFYRILYILEILNERTYDAFQLRAIFEIIWT